MEINSLTISEPSTTLLVNGTLKFQVLKKDSIVPYIEEINRLSSLEKRAIAIYNSESLSLIDINNRTLKNKLIFSNSKLLDILSHALIISTKNSLNNLLEAANELVTVNPLDYNQSLGHRFYHYKLKRFIMDTLFDIRPNLWSSLFMNNKESDFISQSEDILKRAKFQAVNASQNNSGKIYKYNGKLFLKLPLQITFQD